MWTLVWKVHKNPSVGCHTIHISSTWESGNKYTLLSLLKCDQISDWQTYFLVRGSEGEVWNKWIPGGRCSCSCKSSAVLGGQARQVELKVTNKSHTSSNDFRVIKRYILAWDNFYIYRMRLVTSLIYYNSLQKPENYQVMSFISFKYMS